MSSKKVKKPLSLAEKIAQLANPAPKDADIDPEDMDAGWGTKLSADHLEDYEIEEMKRPRGLLSERSAIRKHIAQDVEEIAKEYQGKKVSRKDLENQWNDGQEDDEEEEDEDEDEEEQDDQDDDVEEDEGEDDEDGFEDVEGLEEDDQDGEDEDEDEDEDEEDENDDDEEENEDGISAQQLELQRQLSELEKDSAISLFSSSSSSATPSSSSSSSTSSSLSSDALKALHTSHQAAWFTNLLHARIKMHSALSLANRLPKRSEIKSSLDKPSSSSSSSSSSPSSLEQIDSLYEKTIQSTTRILDDLLALQSALFKQNPTVWKRASQDNKKKNEQKDQEDVTAEGALPTWQGRKKIKLSPSTTATSYHSSSSSSSSIQTSSTYSSAYWSFLDGQLHPFLDPIVRALIEKWHEKIQISAGQLSSSSSSAHAQSSSSSSFKVINQSVLGQIDALLADPQRLIKKSQLKRTSEKLIGVKRGRGESEQQEEDDENAQGTKGHLSSQLINGRLEVYDEEIYDDNDLYQHLLHEIISSSSVGGGNGGLTDAFGNPIASSTISTSLSSSLGTSLNAVLTHGAFGQGGGLATEENHLLSLFELERKKAKLHSKKNLMDRRASKGRKLKYVVIPKLTNFMAPEGDLFTLGGLAAATQDTTLTNNHNNTAADSQNTSHILEFAVDELFMNLFGHRTYKKM